MKELIKHLRGLSYKAIQPIDPEEGLCVEIQNYYRSRNNEIPYPWQNVVRMIEESSGPTTGFPVNHNSLSANAAYRLMPLWNNDRYGDRRRRLCGWLADKLGELDV